MEKGTLIFIIALAIVIIYLFGFTVFLWCALAGLFGLVFAFFFMIYRDKGKLKKLSELQKISLKGYKKLEYKFFKWIDSI